MTPAVLLALIPFLGQALNEVVSLFSKLQAEGRNATADEDAAIEDLLTQIDLDQIKFEQAGPQAP